MKALWLYAVRLFYIRAQIMKGMMISYLTNSINFAVDQKYQYISISEEKNS
jgi:hypothetical protein